jgi:phosphoglycerol transferase MdoB-like AlkP superfamily enzyme
MNKLKFVNPIKNFIILGLLITTVSRIILFFIYKERIIQTENYWLLFPIGFRMDMIVLSYISFLPLVLLTFLPFKWLEKIRYFFSFYFIFFLVLILFFELATHTFIDQYDTRPNKIFLDYLIYPKEVLETIFKSYLYSTLFALLIVVIAVYFAIKKASVLFYPINVRYAFKLILFPFIAFLLFFGARSSLVSKRPINGSNAVFSNDQLSNSLALNSFYSVGFAAYTMKNDGNVEKLYGKVNTKEALLRVRKYMNVDDSNFLDINTSLLHHFIPDSLQQKNYNVVVFLQESLGAEYVGSLGGLPLTPEFDKLTQEGLLFTNLYCTGTRSVRGIESVVTGFSLSPAESVVKMSNSQTDFFTLGSFFKTQGYDTSFIYGGMSNFDNMGSFFNGNGFDNIIDEQDFNVDKHSYAFKGTWGYSDEDLAVKANNYFKSQGNKPFFSLMFSTSNHDPFEFPDGRIKLYGKQKNTVHNAIKYADFSIGKFIELAKKEAYFKNTIFLIIADHNTRTYGNYLVPIKKFRIPALLIGPNISKGKTYDKLCSQIDIPVSLLDKVGKKADIPMSGRNLFTLNEKEKGRSIMLFHSSFSFRVDNDIVVLQPNKEPLQFKVEKDSILKPTLLNEELAKDALSHISVADYLYKTRNYNQGNKKSSTK